MADSKELLALLDVLQKRGAARVKLDPDGNLQEVEFTPGGPPIDPDPTAAEDAETAHEMALRQIGLRSFQRPNGVATPEKDS
jgi:hypothetical protein